MIENTRLPSTAPVGAERACGSENIMWCHLSRHVTEKKGLCWTEARLDAITGWNFGSGGTCYQPPVFLVVPPAEMRWTLGCFLHLTTADSSGLSCTRKPTHLWYGTGSLLSTKPVWGWWVTVMEGRVGGKEEGSRQGRRDRQEGRMEGGCSCC